MRSCSIIILSYNGKDLLAECIPSVIEAVKFAGGEHEIIVVDNASTDDTVEYVKNNFPAVRLLVLDKNYRFVGGNNRGILAAAHDIVVLLNNDMVVDKNFLTPLLEGFKDDTVFAVTSQIFFTDQGKRREETGKTGIFWDKGMIYPYHEDVDEIDGEREYVPIVWAGGGSAAYDKKIFVQLGMFDELYQPCYVDDLDISYLAWRCGWKSLFCPRSIVHHKHRATHVKQFSKEELNVIIQSHQLLFLWKNLSSLSFLISHFFFLPLHILKQYKRGEPPILLKAVMRAFAKFPQLIKSRILKRPRALITDRMIFKKHYIKNSCKISGQLKILFVCPYIPCLGIHAGGGRMYQVIKGLSKIHAISVLTFIENEEEKIFAEHLKEFCSKVIYIQRRPKYREPNWFHTNPNRYFSEFSDPEMKRILDEEARSGKYDIIQFEYIDIAHLALIVKRYNVPMILTYHEVQSRSIWHDLVNNKHNPLERLQLLYRWMIMLNYELRIIRLFDLVLFMTGAEQKSLLDYSPRLPNIVHQTGVDVSYFAEYNHLPYEEHSMVFVGYYRHLPNEDAMIYFCSEIFPIVKNEFSDARMYIVGSDPPYTIKNLHDGKSVIVTGRVEDTRPFMAKASVYVVPIRLGAGIRGKITEAWSMKKPVVATSIAASGLQVQNDSNIIIADTASAFAEQIIRIFKDNELRNRLAENGFQTAKSYYDWNGQITKHCEIYSQLLQ